MTRSILKHSLSSMLVAGLAALAIAAPGAAPASASVSCTGGNHEWKSSAWGQAGYCVYPSDAGSYPEFRFYIDDLLTDGSCVWTQYFIPDRWTDLADGRGSNIRSCGPNTRYDTQWNAISSERHYWIARHGIRVLRSGNYFTLCDGTERRVSGPASCLP